MKYANMHRGEGADRLAHPKILSSPLLLLDYNALKQYVLPSTFLQDLGSFFRCQCWCDLPGDVSWLD